MKLIYIILVIILVVIIYYFSIINKNKNNQHKVVVQKDNPYINLRNLALSTTVDQLNIEISKDKQVTYGMVMDWDLGNGTATLVTFITGDASLYLSSGGGIIGGIGHESVMKASKKIINFSTNYLKDAVLTDATILPAQGELKFYFLTNKGIYTITEQMQNIENGNSQFLELFEEANKLITEIRIVSE